MGEGQGNARLVGADLVACVEETMAVATLRYFTPAGTFAEAVEAATGSALPAPLAARELAGAQLILAWRSPTETLCIARSAGRLAGLIERLAGAAGGCIVDLTGAVRIVRLTGVRTGDLLCRLGASTCVPAVGEARRGRLADVPVLACSLRAGETLLAVDRVYLPHLLAWVRETLLDFDAA